MSKEKLISVDAIQKFDYIPYVALVDLNNLVRINLVSDFEELVIST